MSSPLSDAELKEKKDRAFLAVKQEAIRRGHGKGSGGYGVMPCPIFGCKGTVKFIVYNATGKLMASCTKCVLVNIRED